MGRSEDEVEDEEDGVYWRRRAQGWKVEDSVGSGAAPIV
jgi:hypothetical protein